MKIIDFIPTGAANAISMKQLSDYTGLTPREARRAVFLARKASEPICSSCEENDGGYFMPDNPAEAIPYFKMQLSRIKSANIALAAVKKYVEAEGDDARI